MSCQSANKFGEELRACTCTLAAEIYLPTSLCCISVSDTNFLHEEQMFKSESVRGMPRLVQSSKMWTLYAIGLTELGIASTAQAEVRHFPGQALGSP